MIEHNGKLIETREESQVLRDLLDWWKADCGWGTAQAIATPAMADGPSAFAPNVEILPKPTSNAPRYRPHSPAYGLNSLGRKSHRKAIA